MLHILKVFAGYFGRYCIYRYSIAIVIVHHFKWDRKQLSSAHTSFRGLKSAALAWRTFSFIIKDPDGEVVDAVGLEARQPSLVTVPAERQDLLLRFLLQFVFVKAAHAVVVHLNEATHGWIQSRGSNMQLTLLSEWTLYPCSFPRTEDGGTGSQCTSAKVLLGTLTWTLLGADNGTATQRENIQSGSLTDFRSLWERALLKCATMISLLTVFSRIPDHRVGLRAAAVIVDGLNPDLIGHVCGRPRHNKLGNIGHILYGPVPVRVQLSPLDSVLQTRPVGLKTCQRLCRGKKKKQKNIGLFAVTSIYLTIK